MENIVRTKVKDLLKSEPGKDVLAKGWVRTKRGNKNVAFIALNDGSTIYNIQIVVDKTLFAEDVLSKITTGACIGVTGALVESVGSGQAVEIQAKEIEVYGECDPMRFPLQKKDTSFEYLRTVAHMRMRTNTFGAVLRVRNQMAFAIHEYFHSKGFVYLNTPLITESDCEGAGQMFQVTTLDLDQPLHAGQRQDGQRLGARVANGHLASQLPHDRKTAHDQAEPGAVHEAYAGQVHGHPLRTALEQLPVYACPDLRRRMVVYLPPDPDDQRASRRVVYCFCPFTHCFDFLSFDTALSITHPPRRICRCVGGVKFFRETRAGPLSPKIPSGVKNGLPHCDSPCFILAYKIHISDKVSVKSYCSPW